MSPLTDERFGRFNGAVEVIKEKEIIILMSHVDPDSIGAAFGCKEVFSFLGCEHVKVVYNGVVSHPQNKEIFNQYGLYDLFIEAAEVACNVDAVFVWVDSSKIEDSRLPDCFKNVIPQIVIDHHRGEDLPEQDQEHFYWVEDIGSASTLVCELGIKLEMAFSKEARTLLALGVHNDTKSLIKANSRDVKVFEYLNGEDVSVDLNALNSFELPPSYFEILVHALTNSESQDENVIANAGIISAGDGDFLSIIADLLILERGTSLVFVWGIIDNMVRIAARSKGSGISLNELLKDKFGKENAGAKFTPDRRGEGGALLNMGFLRPTKNKKVQEAVLNSVALFLREKFFGESE
ncbi:bifunctional oligoribonuclease/PAP phosphatase NrnA [Patescibacteria group bacterium]